MLTTILAIAAAATGLGALIFGAAHQRKTANTLKDIHNVIQKNAPSEKNPFEEGTRK